MSEAPMLRRIPGNWGSGCHVCLLDRPAPRWEAAPTERNPLAYPSVMAESSGAVENSRGGRASLSWGAVECLNVDANKLSITLEQGSLGGAPFLCLCMLFPGGCELGMYGFERRAARNLSDANEIVRVKRAHPHFARLVEFSSQHFGCETLHCSHQPFGRVLAANSADSSAYQAVGCKEAD